MTASFDPYAAPVAMTERRQSASWRRPLRRSLVWFGVSLVGWALAATLDGSRGGAVEWMGFAFAAVCSLLGAGFACVAAWRAARRRPAHVGAAFGGAVLAVAQLAMGAFGALLAMLSVDGGRGRQLRRWGRVLLPRLRPGAAWSHATTRYAVDDGAREELAAQWRENARTEHASVGAFALLTLDLIALGAPPELLDAANRDGRDEVQHARACLAIATSIDGSHRSPAPFPDGARVRSLFRTRALALARLAVESLVDGVLHEGLSARVLGRLSRLTERGPIREAVARLAADEGRHSAHAWQVVLWCVEQGGASVVFALQGATRALPAAMNSRRPSAAALGAWQRWGIPGQALESREYAASRAFVVRRVEEVAASFARSGHREVPCGSARREEGEAARA